MRDKARHAERARMKQERQRDYYVCLSNALIQKFSLLLSAKGFRMFMYVASMIKPDDSGDTVYSFSVVDYSDVCGITCDSGKSYEMIRDTVKELATATATARDTLHGRTVEREMKLFDDVRYNPEKHAYMFRFSADIVPYMFNLTARYTRFKLGEIMPFRSVYAQRLYLLMKSYSGFNGGEVSLKLDELRRLMVGVKYAASRDFKRLIRTACDEIARVRGMAATFSATVDRAVFSIVGDSTPDSAHIARMVWAEIMRKMTQNAKLRAARSAAQRGRASDSLDRRDSSGTRSGSTRAGLQQRGRACFSGVMIE